MIAWLVYVWPNVYPNLIASAIVGGVLLAIREITTTRRARAALARHHELLNSHAAIRELLAAAHVDVTVDVTESITVEKVAEQP